MISVRNHSKILYFYLLGLTVVLNGCIHWPIDIKKNYSQVPYPPVNENEVVFIPSVVDFPLNSKAIRVADLASNSSNYESYQVLLKMFQKKAGELGANVVVLDRTDMQNNWVDNVLYFGTATAYRLYKKNPSENLDLRYYFKASQSPPEPKSKVILTYPDIKSH
jgi:hypothetical protein